jgi:hypothetical protein
MVKSSESEEWYSVGTLPIELTMFSVKRVFIDPGGPAIMCMPDRRRAIFWADQKAHGRGRGSPADRPFFTLRARV